MVKKPCNLSQSRQCRLLSVGRTSVYYRPKESGQTQDLMKRIDVLYTEDPTFRLRSMHRPRCPADMRCIAQCGYKSRSLQSPAVDGKDGFRGHLSQAQSIKTTPGTQGLYPYLLRNVKVTRVNQVWSTDITYIRLRHGFVYLTAIIDWYSRYVCHGGFRRA